MRAYKAMDNHENLRGIECQWNGVEIAIPCHENAGWHANCFSMPGQGAAGVLSVRFPVGIGDQNDPHYD